MDKTYRAVVEGELNAAHVAAFAAGLHLPEEDGSPAFDAQSAHLEIEAPNIGRVTVHEGKFHQVKRMFAAVGCPVTSLHRLTFGSLTLDASLPEGQWRELTEEELSALYADAQMEASK